MPFPPRRERVGSVDRVFDNELGAVRSRSSGVSAPCHGRAGPVRSPGQPAGRGRRNRQDRPRSSVPGHGAPTRDRRAAAASHAATLGTCAGVVSSTGRCFRASRASVTRLGRHRPVEPGAPNRDVVGRRRRQATSQRSAWSYKPARMAKLAFPSQTRSSSEPTARPFRGDHEPARRVGRAP